MRKIRHISRVLVMLTALVCAAMAASQLTLFAHLATSHPSEKHHHEHDCGDETPHSQPHENCPTCQLLLDAAGKFLFFSPAPIDDEINAALFAGIVNSQFICQHNGTSLTIRGPPIL